MFYWVKFKCSFCKEAGGFQGWCLCHRDVYGDPTIKISKDGQRYTDGEIQMWPVFDHDVIDPWHFVRAYWIFDPRFILEIIKEQFNKLTKKTMNEEEEEYIVLDEEGKEGSRIFNSRQEAEEWAAEQEGFLGDYKIVKIND